MTIEQTERTELLLGKEQLERIKNSHVLVVGVGGVGGFALEMLARSGVETFTIVDADRISLSNCNRQILALPSNVGELKAEVAKQRVLSINPTAKVTVIAHYLEEADARPLVEQGNFDFVLDCIDTVIPKCALIEACVRLKVPFISSMGAGAKTDPTRIKIADISKTEYCSLARVVRRKLAEKKIKKGVPVVYSSEVPIATAVKKGSSEKGKGTTVGTISYLPNLFGGYMVAYTLEKLATNKKITSASK